MKQARLIWRYSEHILQSPAGYREQFLCLLPTEQIPWEWLQRLQEYQLYEHGMFWRLSIDPTPLVIA